MMEKYMEWQGKKLDFSKNYIFILSETEKGFFFLLLFLSHQKYLKGR